MDKVKLKDTRPAYREARPAHAELHNGQWAVGWLAYLLTQADYRKSALQEWANAIPHTLGRLLDQPIREVESSHERLGGMLRSLSDDEAGEAIEQDLWAATVAVTVRA